MSRTRQTALRDMHARLRAVIAHLEHLLPGQAAIRDFVHHNTLHGFQHLPFPEAIAQAQRITGACGYLPAERFRDCYRDGRITQADLEQVIDADPALQSGEVLFNTAAGAPVPRRTVQLTALLHPLTAVTGCQLNWQIEEGAALATFQPDVDATTRDRLLRAARQQGQADEPAAIDDLWTACLQTLGLEHYLLHPEELLDLPPEMAEALLSQVITNEENSGTGQLLMDRLVDREAGILLDELFEQTGGQLTLAGLLRAVSGEDLMEAMRPLLIRHVGAFLDQGVAAWTSPDRQRGFYSVWRDSALQDLAWVFDDLTDWQDIIDALPEDPLDTIVIELRWLGLPEDQWEHYLERLALELPGWSGMFLWRHNRPDYAVPGQVRVDMADYLAVRLVLEHLFAQRLCRRMWMIEASLDVIRWYFRHNLAEFLVRYMVYNRHLPE
ncbi:MAG: Na-translocating system protein MpsB, partial [Gammaproteobacteria bacterium]